ASWCAAYSPRLVMSLRMFIATLLPQLHGLHVDQASITDAGLTLVLATTRRTACCPLCSRRSARIHSRYQRTLADLPWGGHSVTLRVEVRRFFCSNRRCARAIFAERLPELAAPHARRTNAQHALLLDVACALGGQPGARLAGANV
ncbi:MAG TPA: transposase family protein, partial [Chloroflexota bacterium]|nr:transposase family protein [Chloroflexota bacterium]